MAKQPWVDMLLGGLAGAGQGIAMQQDYRRKKLRDAQDTEIHQLELAKLRAPKAPNRQFDSERGGFVDLDNGTFTAIPGLPAKPKQPKRQFDSDRGGFVDLESGTFTAIPGLPQKPQSSAPMPWQTIQTADGFAQVDPRSGQTRSVQGAGGQPIQPPHTSKAPGEFASKAALVYQRAANAAQTLDKYYDKGAPLSSMAAGVPLVGNAIMNDSAQSMNQAAETIASAILRLESGAAVTQDEVRSYARQFLPQPFDSDEVRKQKRATLQSQLERMKQAALPAMGTPQHSPRNPFAK